MLKIETQDRQTLVEPLFRAGPGFYGLVLVLLAIIGVGSFVYIRQILQGLVVTGMQRPTYWGVYMVNFVFFIGISHAGTLISAILRVTQAEWRRPITRIAEAITVVALIVGTFQILFDMGRPDRLLLVFQYGRLQSPLLWDAVSVTTYFLGSMTYLYLPLIPDVAILRDNLPATAPAWRQRLYHLLALGWRGNRTQWIRLERVIAVMAIIIIPVAVSVHTIISWILATTVQPGWHSTVFGPYFVVGAIFSGIGALFIAMTIMRWVFHLEAYITERQYSHLGYLLIAMSVIWFYFTYTEHLILAAGQEESEFPVLASKLWGEYAPGFWLMILLMIIAFWVLVFPRLIPMRWGRALVFQPRFALAATISMALALMLTYLPQVQPVMAGIGDVSGHGVLLTVTIILALVTGISILPWLKQHIVTSTVIASFCVVVGMWLERWNIIVPTMTHPRLIPWLGYTPTATEWSLTVASFALFAFLFLIFFKLFPPVSIWEVAEGRVIEQTQAQVEVPLPESSTPPRRRFGIARR
jgi:molybdopterin-containing oxidoreductase family membrane subunit